MDVGFATAMYPAYTTSELREWLRRPHSGMTPDVTMRVYREIERREKVEAGDWSVMTPGERLRSIREKEGIS